MLEEVDRKQSEVFENASSTEWLSLPPLVLSREGSWSNGADGSVQGRGKGGEFLCQVRAKQRGLRTEDGTRSQPVVLECALWEGQQQRMVVGLDGAIPSCGGGKD